jgi:hypothetical protein
LYNPGFFHWPYNLAGPRFSWYIYIFIFLIYRRLASDILGFEDMSVERLCSFGVSGVYRSL